MSTVNKVILIGHLGDEVKMHYFDDSNCIGRFPIATSESYTNRQTGERVTNTEWHNIIVRDKTAQNCEQYLSKGSKVYVEGKIKTRTYEVEGQKRYSKEIHANIVTFMGGKDQQQASQSNTATNTQSVANPNEPFVNDGGDDLPF